MFQELYLYDSAGKEIFSENVVKFVSAFYLQTLCITNNLVPLQTGVCMHVCVCVFLQVVCVCVCTCAYGYIYVFDCTNMLDEVI